jgi:hypothetical protein
MIRLGSLAGYPFEGPRALAGWTPQPIPAVYVVMTLDDAINSPTKYSTIYVGEAEDLTKVGFPFKHSKSPAWITRAGNKFNLYVAWFEVLGGTRKHRTQIVGELLATYEPSCNDEKYEQAWRDEWIGEYSNTNTDPLTTNRNPNK